MNAQNQTTKSRTTLHGVKVTMTMRSPAMPQASAMAEYSEAPKTPMMS